MTTETQRNGISLEALNSLVSGIAEHPEAGVVTVRTAHRWNDGLAIDGRGQQATLAGEVLDRRHHTFRTDWPEPWGTDTGPTPGAESLLAAVGACVATTYILAATQLAVRIDELEVEVAGTVDLGRALEISPGPPAFSTISASVRVHSSAPDDVLEALAEAAQRGSPVYQSLANPVPMALSIERIA